ncbi:hypothetical protein KIPB_001224 [Kipferlia bialata]|uniref:Kelch repeat protein n=1 Tax=Kipferlia bialata TaxID=797122 RepID=A0A9K3CQD3_9EUKA|nr:hypothetical protein KIPB_001224 [Kipferlia bialata]|eukprot:g1224.t1
MSDSDNVGSSPQNGGITGPSAKRPVVKDAEGTQGTGESPEFTSLRIVHPKTTPLEFEDRPALEVPVLKTTEIVQLLKNHPTPGRFLKRVRKVPDKDTAMVLLGNGDVFVFGGRETAWHAFHADTFIYSNEDNTWEEHYYLEEQEAVSPCARFGAVAFTHTDSSSEEHVYMFGGAYYNDDGDKVTLNDLWKFTRSPANDGVSVKDDEASWVWEQVAQSTIKPSDRKGGSVIVRGDTAYLFGGRGSDTPTIDSPQYLNDLWTLDIPNATWSLVQDSSMAEQADDHTRPARRYAHSATDFGDGFVVVGGRTYWEADMSKKARFFNDVWQYDVVADTWTELLANGTDTMPCKYKFGTALDASTNTLSIFGGWMWNGVHNFYDDTHTIDLTNAAEGYSLVETEHSPIARAGMVSWEYDGDFYVFGGINGYSEIGNYAFNDMWHMPLEDKSFPIKYVLIGVGCVVVIGAVVLAIYFHLRHKSKQAQEGHAKMAEAEAQCVSVLRFVAAPLQPRWQTVA